MEAPSSAATAWASENPSLHKSWSNTGHLGWEWQWMPQVAKWNFTILNRHPLVNVNKKLWKDPPFSMGKSTISTVIFNSYFDITRG